MKSARENFVKALDGHPVYYRRARGQSVHVPRPAYRCGELSTWSLLRAAATDEDLLGGFLSRFLFCAPITICLSGTTAGRRSVAERLTDVLRRWRKMALATAAFDDGVAARALEYGYAVAPYSKGEHVDITESEDQAASVTYIRYPTLAQKIAILVAASECPEPPGLLHVTMRHMLLAISMVEGFRQYAVHVLKHMEKRDPLMADAEKLLAKMRRYPGKDRSEYLRLMHWPGKKFAAAAVELESSRQVRWSDEPSTGGRTSRHYFAK